MKQILKKLKKKVKQYFYKIIDIISTDEDRVIKYNSERNIYFEKYFYTPMGSVSIADRIIFFTIFLSLVLNGIFKNDSSLFIEVFNYIVLVVFLVDFSARVYIKDIFYLKSKLGFVDIVALLGEIASSFQLIPSIAYIRYFRFLKLFKLFRLTSYKAQMIEFVYYHLNYLRTILRSILYVLIFAFGVMLFAQFFGVADDQLSHILEEVFKTKPGEPTTSNIYIIVMFILFTTILNLILTISTPAINRINESLSKEKQTEYLNSHIVIYLENEEGQDFTYLEELIYVFVQMFYMKTILISKNKLYIYGYEKSTHLFQFKCKDIFTDEFMDLSNIKNARKFIHISEKRSSKIDAKKLSSHFGKNENKNTPDIYFIDNSGEKLKPIIDIETYVTKSKSKEYFIKTIRENIKNNFFTYNSPSLALYIMMMDNHKSTVSYNLIHELDKVKHFPKLDNETKDKYCVDENTYIIVEKEIKEVFEIVDKIYQKWDKETYTLVVVLTNDHFLMKKNIHDQENENFNVVYMPLEVIISLAIAHDIFIDGMIDIWMASKNDFLGNKNIYFDKIGAKYLKQRHITYNDIDDKNILGVMNFDDNKLTFKGFLPNGQSSNVEHNDYFLINRKALKR